MSCASMMETMCAGFIRPLAVEFHPGGLVDGGRRNLVLLQQEFSRIRSGDSPIRYPGAKT